MTTFTKVPVSGLGLTTIAAAIGFPLDRLVVFCHHRRWLQDGSVVAPDRELLADRHLLVIDPGTYLDGIAGRGSGNRRPDGRKARIDVSLQLVALPNPSPSTTRDCGHRRSGGQRDKASAAAMVPKLRIDILFSDIDCSSQGTVGPVCGWVGMGSLASDSACLPLRTGVRAEASEGLRGIWVLELRERVTSHRGSPSARDAPNSPRGRTAILMVRDTSELAREPAASASVDGGTRARCQFRTWPPKPYAVSVGREGGNRP